MWSSWCRGKSPSAKPAAAVETQKHVQIEAQSDIQELQVLGDWAFLRNCLDITITPPGGAAVRHTGYTLTILRKETDGRWLLARDANLMMPQA
jgi:uncharacterized protein (TIGR02246 family)